ncbi:DUF2800 domain-containing protein [Sporosarcina contaminans]|uniref:DUF2800 domain-containing protein n=1 Tax=Sporosarcina contaminans TaxID=633403 RepID=A0ABW3TT60_9BACL
MTVPHSERAHAKLSASGSSRWMACTPSAALESDKPDTSSIFAEEGTAAHELSEIFLLHEIGDISKRARSIRLNKFKRTNEHYSQAMEDYVQSYVDVVMERVNEARASTPDALVLIEQRLDFSEWVPEGFGTGDVLILADGQLEVVDLKYGKGVPVDAENNSQMRLYGLGAYDRYSMLYDIDRVRMTIVQPRLDSISSETLSAVDLLAWGENEVKPKAEMAWNGEGEFVPGSHCRFCKVAPVCRARAEENLKMAEYDFADPPTLSHDEIARILEQADELQKWAKDIAEYALEQAEKHGAKFDGWKLVEGRSNRKYTNPEAVAELLLEQEYEPAAIFKPQELKTITALEKELGKKVFAEVLADLIEKPPGKPTLVPVSDKRPELQSRESAEDDFADSL